MNDLTPDKNRKARRSNVLMSAAVEYSGVSIPVKLKNLSSEGALVEAGDLPIEGAEVLFRKAELSLRARIAWVEGKRAGISFAVHLSPEAVLRHVPTPRARVQPEFRRPGFGPEPLSREERSYGERYIWRDKA